MSRGRSENRATSLGNSARVDKARSSDVKGRGNKEALVSVENRHQNRTERLQNQMLRAEKGNTPASVENFSALQRQKLLIVQGVLQQED